MFGDARFVCFLRLELQIMKFSMLSQLLDSPLHMGTHVTFRVGRAGIFCSARNVYYKKVCKS